MDLSKYPRNMLKLMAKMGGSTKKIADNLIGQREVPSASRLGVFMAAKKRKRWQSRCVPDEVAVERFSEAESPGDWKRVRN